MAHPPGARCGAAAEPLRHGSSPMRARGVYATCISRHDVPLRDRFRLRFKINDNVASPARPPGAPRPQRCRTGCAAVRRARPPLGAPPTARDAARRRRCRPVWDCARLGARADAPTSLNTIENICYSRSWSGVAVHGRRMQPRETRARRRQYTRRKTYNLLPKGVYNSRRRLALIDAANACGRAP